VTLPSPPAGGQGVTISGPIRTANRTPAAWVHLPLKIEVCRGAEILRVLQVHKPHSSRVKIRSKIIVQPDTPPPGQGARYFFATESPARLLGTAEGIG
jgi:hypothetical protein